MYTIRVSIYCQDGAIAPEYKSERASGVDLCAYEGGVLLAGTRKLVRTGVHVAIPAGFEGQVRPRSGLSNDHGITVTNSPGTIDADYRGEIKVILQNTGSLDFEYKKGDRIAQMVFVPVARAQYEHVSNLEDLGATVRSEGGFGHTGR